MLHGEGGKQDDGAAPHPECLHVVLVGGPCGGKSSAIPVLRDTL